MLGRWVTAIVVLAVAATAVAYWTAGGSGSGSAPVAGAEGAPTVNQTTMLTAMYPGDVGNAYTTTVDSGGSFIGFAVDAISQGSSCGYDVTATDLAGNISAITTVSGTL